ncbi:hypothetical protein DERF_006140 [Dermatophagoides farinae]|uniref:Uncharacterized protein n=1 Tax=Dermatophagoides farinae TaxID=6954 RepID=A0A922I8C5_DERFA|nr:hypothetical protein DERF_006140 [Dermatophagoides farinae]
MTIKSICEMPGTNFSLFISQIQNQIADNASIQQNIQYKQTINEIRNEKKLANLRTNVIIK